MEGVTVGRKQEARITLLGNQLSLAQQAARAAGMSLREAQRQRDEVSQQLDLANEQYQKGMESAAAIVAEAEVRLEQMKADRDAAIDRYGQVKLKYVALIEYYDRQVKINYQLKADYKAACERAKVAEDAYGEACDDPGALPNEPAPGPQAEALMRLMRLVSSERARQKVLHPSDHAGKETRSGNHLILSEEVGEVAQAVLERNGAGLQAELTQVATVALGWLAAELGLDW